jgi:Flp pilus assembly protein TadG
MIASTGLRIRNAAGSHRGTAAVEAALMMPVLVLVLLGAIDIAQYITVSQVVANASREGARVACRATTNNTADVEDVVGDYLRDAFPQLDNTSFQSAAKVQVQYNSVAVPSGDLSRVPSGDPLTVEVSFDFAAVRWLPGLEYWGGSVNTSRTVSRRQ